MHYLSFSSYTTVYCQVPDLMRLLSLLLKASDNGRVASAAEYLQLLVGRDVVEEEEEAGFDRC